MRSIRFQLVALLFITLLPAFAMLLILATIESRRVEQDAANESLAVARLFRVQYDAQVEATREKLELLTLFDEVRTGEPAVCAAKLDEVFPLVTGYTGIYVADLNGDILCAATLSGTLVLDGSSEPINIASQQHFQDTLARGEFSAGALRPGAITGLPVLPFSMPIFDDNGAIARIIGAGRDVGLLNRSLLANDLPDDTSLILLDSQGRIALSDPEVPATMGEVLPVFEDILQAVSQGVATGIVVAPDSNLEDGAEPIRYAWVASILQQASAPPAAGDDASATTPALTQPVSFTPTYYAVVGYTEARSTGSLWRVLRTMLVGFGIAKAAALLVAFLAAEWLIVRRIRHLLQAARQMRAGDLTVRTGINHKSGEIGELAQALDSLAATLQVRDDENKRLIAEVESINSSLEVRFIQRSAELLLANRQLLASQQELRGLSQQLMRLIEQERTRISREIHDQLGQSLTAIKMELSNVMRKVNTDPEEATKHIEAATELANEMVTLVRNIAANLRPGVLDDFGLAAAIDWHVAEFSKTTGIPCNTDIQIDEARLNANQVTSAFRIAQEALTNVSRHARATAVTIRARTNVKDFEIEIVDNGEGFIPTEAQTRSLGMLGMRERAAELGGTIEVASQPGDGAKVRLVLPIVDAPREE